MGKDETTAARLGAVVAEARKRSKETAVAKKTALQVTTSQLPLWSERVRGLPNAMARSALFTCADKRSARRVYRRDAIVSLSNIEIRYTGEELRQDDQDVWLQSVHLARMHRLGDQVEVSGHALLTALGWGRGGDEYARLRASIARMREATVWVAYLNGSEGWSGNLIQGLEWKDAGTKETKKDQIKWKLFFDKKILALFQPDAFSFVEWERRLELPPLAKWLHSFYATHEEPLPYKVETIHRLCGSTYARMSSFRAGLAKALDELIKIGFLTSWEISPRTDLVNVVRTKRTELLTA